jgi:hypothetical protein
MLRPLQFLFGIILGFFVLMPSAASAQATPPAKHDTAAPDPSKPGPEQAALAKLAGDYNRVVKFLGQTGANGAPSSGTAKISVVLGGRFILEESNDVVFGRPVEGMRLYGYNNVTHQYEMARMYTMSTAITMMTGTSSDGGKTVDFTGTSYTGNGKVPLHAQLRVTGDDEFAVTMFTTGADGKEMAFQETDYTRKK